MSRTTIAASGATQPSAEPFGLPTKRLTFRLTGISPLLMNAAGAFAVMPPRGAKPGGNAIPTAEQEARTGLYLDEELGLYFPTAAFRNATLTAAKSLKLKPGGRGRDVSLRSVLAGAWFAVSDRARLLSPATDEPLDVTQGIGWEIDTRRAVPPGQGAVRRSRPLVRQWRLFFEHEYLTEYLGNEAEDAIFQAVKRGGLTIGVGNYRPEKGGPMGRWITERQALNGEWVLQ